ncbi:hypothetical protein [Calothrix sp. PCC 6303]|uniref:hypothetical protein n=1 Tax=Calothrix sp. PCC 6303 TaxID=1170562 RepID=UPI0002A02444|nr:hypothetical protein [Calothrix sp. PCC 6303]AFZ03523.1 hypothetical protein Cal6303_4623 [Calothrix sp. PCC 6303]
MSVNLKLFLILILSLFVTAAAGALIRQQPTELTSEVSKNQQEPLVLSSSVSVNNTVSEPERIGYKTIPLENLKSALQGTEPDALAMQLVEDIQGFETDLRKQKVEITYPHPNQIIVTITQPIVSKGLSKRGNLQQVVSGSTSKSTRYQKYQVELTSIGSTVLVNSPPMWQIVWAGSEE